MVNSLAKIKVETKGNKKPYTRLTHEFLITENYLHICETYKTILTIKPITKC